MKNIARTPRTTLRFLSKVGTAWLAAFMLFTVPVAGLAQEITGSVKGTVTTPSGAPASGETVTVTDTRTGSSRSATTTSTGSFNIRGLTVGGPYTVRVVSGQYESTLITDVFTSLTAPTQFDVRLEEQSAIEEIVVLASQVATAEVALGPNSSFNLEEIEALPTITRQIRDVVRLDPRVSIGRSNSGQGFGISCLGGSGRANSFTIDGVRSADGFGLNASGNAARNTFPIPFDTVASAAVEFSPIDVQYGQFTGCNINVVTKSGTNEFAGSLFYLFNDQNLTGDELNDREVISDPFEDKNYGFEFSGPIIKDKLFFYASYEETDGAGTQNNGPIGGGFANEGGPTVAQTEQIASILSSQYGRTNLDIVRTLPQTSERYFGRLDWNINDSHRLEGTYVRLEESNLEQDDFNFESFTFADNFEVEGTEQDSYSVRLFSNWTDRFSTEFRASTLDVVDLQGPLSGGEAQDAVPLPRLRVQDGMGNTLLLSGPGQFRSANDLQYQLDQFKLAGDYVIGNHTITAGYELDRLEVFNLFIADGTGTLTFNSIADLQSGLASGIRGSGSFTGSVDDAGVTFDRDIHSIYLQDEWQATDRLSVTFGLRYDEYSGSEGPAANPVFQQRYGFSNNTGFDGLDILLPRLGFTYDMPWDALGEMQIRGGFGIFTGGDPTVFFSNAYTNSGGLVGGGAVPGGTCVAADLQVIDGGGNFTGLPQCLIDQQILQAGANNGRVAAVDPNIELPSQNRFNFGISLQSESNIALFNDWGVQLDYIYSDHQDSLDFVDLTLTQNVDAVGAPIFLPDGRPQMNAIDPLRAGCNATFNGIDTLGFSNVTTACDAGGDDQDILLTNGVDGTTTSVAFQLNRSFDFSDKTSMDLRFGYAYTDAEIGNALGSATATSGYEEVAVNRINFNTLGPSPNANKDNFVLGATLKHYFFADHETRVGMFLRRRSGRPISYTYDNNTPTTLFGDSDNEERNLIYVPTGPNDPLVDFTGATQQQLDEFFGFLRTTGLDRFAGQISPKGGFEQPWSTDLDIRIQQDVPLPWADHSFKLFLDIENVLNLFSNSSNLQRFADNGDINEAVPVLDAALSADGTQFIYSNFDPGNDRFNGGATNAVNGGDTSRFTLADVPSDLDVDDSIWRIQFGIRYEFGQ